jgi:DnaJ homolog subfamily C member 28
MKDSYEKASDRNIMEQLKRDRAEQELRGAIERIVDQAAKDGIFDNLPGKGKPLKLGKNRQAGENALAYDLLQNNNYALPWISKRQEMLDKIAAFREKLADSAALYAWRLQQARDLAAEEKLRLAWRDEIAQFESQLREINQAITALNLTIPTERLEVMKMSWEKELARAGISV